MPKLYSFQWDGKMNNTGIKNLTEKVSAYIKFRHKCITQNWVKFVWKCVCMRMFILCTRNLTVKLEVKIARFVYEEWVHP